MNATELLPGVSNFTSAPRGEEMNYAVTGALWMWKGSEWTKKKKKKINFEFPPTVTI